MRWTVVANCDSFFITKCDTVYYKLRQVLQSAMVITNYDSTWKPSEWVCNFLKQLNKVSSCPNLSQRKVLVKPKLFYVKYCCTLSNPWTPGEIITYYPSPWGIFSASITVSLFIIVNLHNRTGEGKRVEVEGGEGVGLRVGGQTLCDKISLTIILFERILRKTSLFFDQIFL